MLVTRLPLICAIFLGALICGSLYWQLSPYILNYFNISNSQQPSAELMQSTYQASNSQSTEDKQRNYPIANFKLFGDMSAPSKPIAVQTENLPETSLKLTLTGVLAGKNNLQASALIEGPDRQTRNYRVDEEVPGGAILKSVYPDRVVLERAGRLENLIFEEKRSIGIETQKQVEEETIAYMPSPNHSSSNLDSFNQQQTQQIKDRLSKLRSRLQNNGP